MFFGCLVELEVNSSMVSLLSCGVVKVLGLMLVISFFIGSICFVVVIWVCLGCVIIWNGCVVFRISVRCCVG